MSRRYRQDPDTHELVEITTSRPPPGTPAVIGDIEPFVSPLDGKLIGSRAALRRHNEEHEVTQHREYGENEGRAYIARMQAERIERMRSRTARDRAERLEAIIPIVTANER